MTGLITGQLILIMNLNLKSLNLRKKMVLLKRFGLETMSLKMNGNHLEQKMIKNLS